MKEQTGTTLIELCIALSLLLVIAPLLVFGSRVLMDAFDTPGMERDVHVFLQELRDEAAASERITTADGQIVLHSSERTIMYEHRSDRIIRRVDYAGFEVALLDVKQMQAREEGKNLNVRVLVPEAVDVILYPRLVPGEVQF